MILLGIFMLLNGLTIGCGGQGAQAPANLKTLTISWPKDIGEMNPHLYNSEMFAQTMVYDSLVQCSNDGRIVPGLAESWRISPDGREYLFTLRKGVKFSDGTDFNAAAAKKNFDAVLANKQSHSWLELIKQIKAIEVIDEYTFKMTLNNAYYPALQELALIRPLRFLAPSAFPDNGNTADTIKKPIGTGPWVLNEYQPGERAVFVRNEYYWRTKPAIERIIVKIIPDSESRVIAFEKKELDLIYGNGSISVDAFKQLRDSGKYDTRLSAPLATRTIALNSNKGPTKDLQVRQALELAVDKDALVKGIFFGTERQADTLFAPNFPYCNINLTPYEFNLEQAGAMLEQAGWRLIPGKEFREKDGQVLALDLCVEATNAIQKSIAEVLQGDMKKIGVKLNLITEEAVAFVQRRKEGDFHMAFVDTWGVPYDPHSLLSSMREPSTDYQAQLGLPMKARLDEAISQALISTNDEKRQELYTYILRTLHDQAIYIPLTYLSNLAVYHKKISGVAFQANQYDIPFADMEVQQD